MAGCLPLLWRRRREKAVLPEGEDDVHLGGVLDFVVSGDGGPKLGDCLMRAGGQQGRGVYGIALVAVGGGAAGGEGVGVDALDQAGFAEAEEGVARGGLVLAGGGVWVELLDGVFPALEGGEVFAVEFHANCHECCFAVPVCHNPRVPQRVGA